MCLAHTPTFLLINEALFQLRLVYGPDYSDVRQAPPKILGLSMIWATLRGRLGARASWVVGPFAFQQVIRFATNIILARLLAPEMFGLMLVVNVLRTGTELLSDIGIGLSVVRTRRKVDHAFLDTAWTLQLIRGLLLTAILLILAEPVAQLYDPALEPILMVTSGIFVVTALHSPALYLMQRNMELRQRAVYDVACTLVQCSLTIALAYYIPSVWALVWGLMLSAMFSTALSYAFGARRLPRLALHRDCALEIIHFGKWIFFATAIYFASSNTDKAMFAAVLPMAAVGVYSIARTFADMATQLAQRLGGFVVFPTIARYAGQHQEAAKSIRQKRRHFLAFVAVGMGGAIAGADSFILIFYDSRYNDAAFMLPILLVGVWFGVLATFAESVLLGCDRPAPAAFGNAVKFGILAAGLPLAFSYSGLFSGLLILALAECGRWLTLVHALVREKLAFFVDDLVLSALLIATAVLTKLGLSSAGLVLSYSEWWALGRELL